jgi:hypothetical protein
LLPQGLLALLLGEASRFPRLRLLRPHPPVEGVNGASVVTPCLSKLFDRQAGREFARHEDGAESDLRRLERDPAGVAVAVRESREPDHDPGPIGRVDLVAFGDLELVAAFRGDGARLARVDTREPCPITGGSAPRQSRETSPKRQRGRLLARGPEVVHRYPAAVRISVGRTQLRPAQARIARTFDARPARHAVTGRADQDRVDALSERLDPQLGCLSAKLAPGVAVLVGLDRLRFEALRFSEELLQGLARDGASDRPRAGPGSAHRRE